MKISLLTVVTMIPFFLSASTESTSLRGGSHGTTIDRNNRNLEDVELSHANDNGSEAAVTWKKYDATDCKGAHTRIDGSKYFGGSQRKWQTEYTVDEMLAECKSKCANNEACVAFNFRDNREHPDYTFGGSYCQFWSTITSTPDAVGDSKDCWVSSKSSFGQTLEEKKPSASPSSQPNSTPSESPSSKPSDSPSSIPVGKTKYSPKEIAKAWKEYDNGTYEEDCANAMAIALGEGLPAAFASPLHYICSPDFPRCEAISTGCLEEPCWSGFMTLEKFLDAPVFDINQAPYDGQLTLGPWQTTTTVLHTDDINVRVGETVDYLTNLCNPRCPGTQEASQCTPNSLYPDRPLTTIFDGDKIKWCGCAATADESPELQTLGYSGRCSLGAADHYTKYTHSEYHSIANQICDSV